MHYTFTKFDIYYYQFYVINFKILLQVAHTYKLYNFMLQLDTMTVNSCCLYGVCSEATIVGQD